MISLLHLNKLSLYTFFFIILIFNSVFAATAVDIWKNNEKPSEQNDNEKEITIESPIISEDLNKITIKIQEQEINIPSQTVIGIFDPEDNNFSLNMWSDSDGEDIKKS